MPLVHAIHKAVGLPLLTYALLLVVSSTASDLRADCDPADFCCPNPCGACQYCHYGQCLSTCPEDCLDTCCGGACCATVCCNDTCCDDNKSNTEDSCDATTNTCKYSNRPSLPCAWHSDPQKKCRSNTCTGGCDPGETCTGMVYEDYRGHTCWGDCTQPGKTCQSNASFVDQVLVGTDSECECNPQGIAGCSNAGNITQWYYVEMDGCRCL